MDGRRNPVPVLVVLAIVQIEKPSTDCLFDGRQWNTETGKKRTTQEITSMNGPKLGLTNVLLLTPTVAFAFRVSLKDSERKAR
ncbi:unnamed protein product [Anisakis simplex]|uniref:Secreted protein n=1 Tax=Anisakis simplex TaxID=6269 RepID=A0A0M3JHU4_ANISI|nr:unnamed protein product [Anisakis simplex]